MDYKITKSKIIHSLFWKLMERSGTQGIQFLVMIVLTRLLLPEDYGLIAIVIIFISIAGLIVESGFTEALIQKKNANEEDFSSVFYLNLIVAIFFYIMLFFMSPFIATFFDLPQLTLVLRILSLTLFLGAFNSIQHVVIARSMQFKIIFTSSIFAVITSGIVGLTLAYLNYGIWALVGQQVTNQFLITGILWFKINWRPRLVFSLARLSSLYSFGWKLVASTFIYNLYTNIQSLIIGKLFSPAMLGFYNRGTQLPNILVSNINGSIQSVMFPVLASQQDNPSRIKNMVKRSIVTSSFIIFPLMVGLSIIAEPLVKVLFTENWLPTVPFLQIFCAYYALWTIDSANLHAIKALGRSDIFLKLEILKFLIGILILIISLPFGVHVVAIGVLVNRVITTIIDAYPNKYLLNYSFCEQFKDVSPSLILSIAMGALVYGFQFLGLSDISTIIIQLVVGIACYIGFAKLFNIECFTYLLNMMNSEKKLAVGNT